MGNEVRLTGEFLEDTSRFNSRDIGDSGAIVESTIADAQALVSAYEAASTAALEALGALDFSIEATAPVGAEILELAIADSTAVKPTSPTLDTSISSSGISSLYYDLSQALNLSSLALASVVIPELDATAPVFTAPSVPTDALPDIPTDLPVTVDPDIPEAPTITFPDAPTLTEVELPEVPVLETISFAAVLPTLELTAPDAAFSWETEEYSSNIADAVRDKLYTDITEGGSGLDETTEQAIYDRAEDRLNYQLSQDYDAALNTFETWGFELPDGILAANLQEVLAEGTRRRAELNRDVLVKQAELAQNNTQFAVTSGLTHEQQNTDFFIKRLGFAFQAAKATWDAALELFRGKMDEFNARMNGYKIQGDVFESRVRAGTSLVERYRIQMEGAKISGELNALEVEIYATRIGAAKTLVELWATEIEGAKLHAELNKAKVEGFIAVLAAKKAQIDAVTAKFNLYTAQLDGEKTKADIYATQVQAFASRVSATKTEADINLAELQGAISANDSKIKVLSEAINGYRAAIEKMVGIAGANTQLYAADIEAFNAEINKDNATIAARVEVLKSQATQADANARLAASNTEANLRIAAMLTEAQTTAATAIANISAQKVASALSVLNVSASMSSSYGISHGANVSNSYQFSESNSDSTSTSQNRNDDIQRHTSDIP